MVFRTIARLAAAKRVPLIKFRKGGPVMSASAGGPYQAPAVSSSASAPPQSKPSASAASPGAVIEDWELPPRYRRKPIDPYEMEYINRGGPPL